MEDKTKFEQLSKKVLSVSLSTLLVVAQFSPLMGSGAKNVYALEGSGSPETTEQEMQTPDIMIDREVTGDREAKVSGLKAELDGGDTISSVTISGGEIVDSQTLNLNNDYSIETRTHSETSEEYSVIVIKEAYLQTLKAGSYTLEVKLSSNADAVFDSITIDVTKVTVDKSFFTVTGPSLSYKENRENPIKATITNSKLGLTEKTELIDGEPGYTVKYFKTNTDEEVTDLKDVGLYDVKITVSSTLPESVADDYKVGSNTTFTYNSVVKITKADFDLATMLEESERLEESYNAEYGSKLSDVSLPTVPEEKGVWAWEDGELLFEELGEKPGVKAFFTPANKNYNTAEATCKIIVGRKDITDASDIEVSVGECDPYDASIEGAELPKPAVEVKHNGNAIVQGEENDYTLEYTYDESPVEENGKLVLKGQVTVTGQGKFTGTRTENFDINVITKPKVSIEIADTELSPFESFLNTISFGIFFKESKTVNITTDTGAEGSTIYYHIGDGETVYESETALEEAGAADGFWTPGSSFSICEADGKFVVYAKVVDKYDNVSYASSNGIVRYSDVTEPVEAEFTKMTEGGLAVDLKSALGENEFLSVTLDGAELSESVYTFDEASSTITFTSEYLNDLEAKEHSFEISYKLKDFESGDETAPIALNVTISKAKLKASDFTFAKPANTEGKDAIIYDNQDKQATVTSDKVAENKIIVQYYVETDPNVYVLLKDEGGAPCVPVNAGKYLVQVSVIGDANYACENVTVFEGEDAWKFTIEKSDFSEDDYTIPENVTAGYGQTLADVSLDEFNTEDSKGVWSWVNEETAVGEVLETPAEFAAKFTPKDEYKANYNEAVVDIPVKVCEKLLDVSMIANIATQLYTAESGNTFTPLPVVTDGEKILVKGTDYEVSYENNTWNSEAKLAEQTGRVIITGKGNYGGTASKTFTIQDAISPTGMIKIGEHEFDGLGEAVTFNDFISGDKTVTITANDAESNVASVKYYISNEDVLADMAELTVENIEAVMSEKWMEYTEAVTLNSGRNVVYAKITDEAGNVKYIRSNGFIAYEDAGTELQSSEFTKMSQKDLEVTVDLKGNELASIMLGDRELIKQINPENDEDTYEYKVGEETEVVTDEATGETTYKAVCKIAFKDDFLNELEAKDEDYIFTINYNPAGEAFVENESKGDKPTPITLRVLVEKGELDEDYFTYVLPSDLTYNGEKKTVEVKPAEGVGNIGAITVKYYDLGLDKISDPINAGRYSILAHVDENDYYQETTLIWGNAFEITKAEAQDIKTPVIEGEVKYGATLEAIELPEGWAWKDKTIVPTVGNESYAVYYTPEDSKNYDWSKVEGYDEANGRVVINREVKVKVVADTSAWGEKVNYNGVVNYVAEDGTISAEVTGKEMIYVKEGDNWYIIDNSEGIFETGSQFWVKWISKEDNEKEWQKYYNDMDEDHKKAVDSGRLWIFTTGVTAPNGKKYTEFEGKVLPYYIQMNNDWTREDINAIFISSGIDEIVDVEFLDNVKDPEGKGEFAKLSIKHFSPYAVYDSLTEEEKKELEEIAKENGMTEEEVKNILEGLDKAPEEKEEEAEFVATGDEKTPLILTGLAALAAISGGAAIALKKKREE